MIILSEVTQQVVLSARARENKTIFAGINSRKYHDK